MKYGDIGIKIAKSWIFKISYQGKDIDNTGNSNINYGKEKEIITLHCN